MDTFLRTPQPDFADAIAGENIHEWLKEHDTLRQIIKNGFAELPINREYLKYHAPRIYDGLSRIIKPKAREYFKITRERNDELPEDMESGLMKRRDDEQKWQFHYFLGIDALLRMQGAFLGDLGIFLRSAHELDAAAFEISCNLGALFDENNHKTANGRDCSLATRITEGKRITRVLDYLPH